MLVYKVLQSKAEIRLALRLSLILFSFSVTGTT